MYAPSDIVCILLADVWRNLVAAVRTAHTTTSATDAFFGANTSTF